MNGSGPFAGTRLHKPHRGAEGGWKGLDAGDTFTPFPALLGMHSIPRRCPLAKGF